MSSQDFTVNELKEFLRLRNLPVTGNRADLIERLEKHSTNVWEELEEEKKKRQREEQGSALRQEDAAAAARLAQIEIEILRREQDLMRREVELLRREQELLHSRETPDRAASVVSAGPSSNISIRAMGDLLGDFDGRSDYGKWEQQVQLLRATYQLEDNAARVLISSKLKERALLWFHSKPAHLTMEVNTLLQDMGQMFKHRPSKLQMRRDFENRQWRAGERFTDYYHDKVILGNQVPIEEEELIDYIVDGIPDRQLRDQARILRFHSGTDLLEAFEKITLDNRKSNDRERKVNITSSSTSDAKPNRSSLVKQLKCFNCQETGHISPNCGKPKRPFGACFECGSTSHQRNECPRRGSRQQARGSQEEPQPSTSTSLLQVTHRLPYMVPISYELPGKGSQICKYALNAILDSGSPISLIRESFVPLEARSPICEDDKGFCGINGSPLEIIGIFYSQVKIENINIELKFYVVPNHTMAFMALLGRDFSTQPYITVTLGDRVVIAKKNTNGSSINELNSEIDQIMNIEPNMGSLDLSDNLQINPKLDGRFVEELKCLYLNYIQSKDNEIGNVNFEMKILLKHDQPISFRPRRLSYSDKEKLQLILDDLLNRNIIRPSESPYASPIVLVRKKNGETRLCIDYRELNKITIKDNFPSPLIDDNIDLLKNKRYFTSLDLKDGYYNVKIAEDSIAFTSFVTPLGQFEFLFCPFGLTNAPKVFGRFIKKIFAEPLQNGEMMQFFDDFLIATATLEDHFEILKKVFRLTAQAKLTLRLDKCFFVQTEIDYLGYRVSYEGIRPTDQNIAAVLNYPVPRNAKEVLRFVSLASYFRRFVPAFSVLAKPLYDLVRKNAKFEFGAKQHSAFEILKEHLASKPILAIYSPTAETELHCDASTSGFGAILLQKQEDGLFKPIFYFSQRTTPAEAKYHSFELECLAVVNAIKRFHVYLGGIKFKIITDCDSFRLTLSKQQVNPRIARWAMFLQDYDYEIFHRPGKRMSHVDALSRCHSVLVIEANTFDQTLAICQNRDVEINKIRDTLEHAESKLFELRDGLVYWKNKNKELLFYVPQSMENNVIRTCHDELGHVGYDKVVNNLLKIYWFPKLREKVKEYIANCLRCIEFSPLSGKPEGFLHNIDKEKLPFQTLHIDHLGPLEKTKKGYKHLFVIVDAFTKFIKLYPCKSTKSEECVNYLTEYFRAYSKPRRVISDRGTAFTSALFTEFLKSEEIDHVLIAVGTPRANGQVERFNKTITPMIAKLSDSPEHWDRVLGRVEFACNNTVSRTTNNTPSRLLFGIDQVGEINDCIRLMLEDNSEKVRDLEQIRESATQHIAKAQKCNEINYNKKRKEASVYSTGDYVMIKNVDTTAGVNKKFIPKFKGPYVVKKVLDCDRYVIEDIDGFQVTRLPYNGVVAPDNMKPYIS